MPMRGLVEVSLRNEPILRFKTLTRNSFSDMETWETQLVTVDPSDSGPLAALCYYAA